MGCTGYKGVKKSSSSSIEICFQYQGKRCRERIKKKPDANGLKEAHLFRLSIEDAKRQGIFDYQTTFPNSKNATKFKQTSGVTIAVWLDSYFKSHSKHLKSSTAHSQHKIIYNQLIPAFGELGISEFKWIHFKQWIKAQDITTKTISNKLSVFRAALDEAVDDELIKVNPLKGKTLRGNKSKKSENIDPFSNEERNVIINTATGQMKNIIQFAFWTGMRTSELCALNWGDIDWHKKTIRVDKALTQAASKIEDPKTTAGIRDVKLLPDAISALERQKDYTYLKSDEIFQNPNTQERWNGDKQYRSNWKTVLKKAKVRYRYPYQTRHSWASMMLMAGEHIMWVSKQIGHTSWAFTASTYSKWIDNDAPDAGEKAAAMFSKNKYNSQLEKRSAS